MLEVREEASPPEEPTEGEEQQEEKVQRHRQIQTQIQEMWSRFKPKRKRGKRAPEPRDA
jgi:hypothetical protein